MNNEDLINQLKLYTESLLNNQKIREGVLYKYMPFEAFISMCKSAFKKLSENSETESFSNRKEDAGYLDLFCFDAETYNDPREGKILIELSEENECTNGDMGLLAQLYRETEIDKNLVDINTIVFVGSFVFEQKVQSGGNRAKKSGEINSYTENFPNSPGDALPMWRDYADKGRGVCLQVNVSESQKLPLYRVSYDRKQQFNVLYNICKILSRFPEKFRKENASRLREIIDPVRFLFKSKEHDYENEARIIKVYGFNAKVERGNFDNTVEEIKLLEKKGDSSLSRLYIVLEDFFFKQGGKVIVGPAFEESDYLFGKRVVIKQVYYWLKRLKLLDKVEVKASKYNIRF